MWDYFTEGRNCKMQTTVGSKDLLISNYLWCLSKYTSQDTKPQVSSNEFQYYSSWLLSQPVKCCLLEVLCVCFNDKSLIFTVQNKPTCCQPFCGREVLSPQSPTMETSKPDQKRNHCPLLSLHFKLGWKAKRTEFAFWNQGSFSGMFLAVFPEQYQTYFDTYIN